MYPDKKADFGSTICGKLALKIFVSLQLVYLGQHFLSPLTRNPTYLSILGLSEETLTWNCSFVDGCVVCLREVNQTSLFQLLNVNDE